MPHPIENMMETSVAKLKEIVDVNTVVGKPVAAGEKGIIMPISKVSLGFLSGGGEYGIACAGPVKRSSEMLENTATDYPFAGAAVAGMNLTPMGFLYVDKNSVRLLSTNFPSPIDRIIDAVPQILETVQNYIKENQNDADTPSD